MFLSHTKPTHCGKLFVCELDNGIDNCNSIDHELLFNILIGEIIFGILFYQYDVMVTFGTRIGT